jgi:hypothetical protein
VVEQLEVANQILLSAEQRMGNRSCGVVNSQEETEGQMLVAEPVVLAPVNLQQHSLLWEALSPQAAARPMPSSVPQPAGDERVSHCAAADVDFLPLSEEFRQVSVVRVSVPLASKGDDPIPCLSRRGVHRPAAAVAVHEAGDSRRSERRQQPPHVPLVEAQDLSRIRDGRLPAQDPTQHIDPRLFSWAQRQSFHGTDTLA